MPAHERRDQLVTSPARRPACWAGQVSRAAAGDGTACQLGVRPRRPVPDHSRRREAAPAGSQTTHGSREPTGWELTPRQAVGVSSMAARPEWFESGYTCSCDVKIKWSGGMVLRSGNIYRPTFISLV